MTNPFGQCIREQRDALGLRLLDVAQAIGVSVTLMSEIERGTRSPFADEQKLDALAQVLGLRPDRVRDLAMSARGLLLRATTIEQHVFISHLAAAWDHLGEADLQRLIECLDHAAENRA